MQRPISTFAPRTANEVTDAIRWAAAEGEPLEVLAGGTRRALGRPVDAPHLLNVSALRGVLSYEPEELILTALPGTPLAEIETMLAERGQCLAFEPPDFATLLGTPKNSTLGGAVATGLSGPRRPKAGAARDHVLGVSAASGRGEFFIAGGKVVKNVTGYDVPKLLTGSYGTLAVLTEITVKVLPAPETTRTLVIEGQTAPAAVATMTAALQTAAEVSGACYLPGVTALRFEGVAPSVEFRLNRLRELMNDKGSQRVLGHEESLTFWREVRDVAPFARDTTRLLWRVSVPPAQGAEVLARIQRALPSSEAFLDWGGGLIWVQLEATSEVSVALAGAEKIRAAVAVVGGHAMLIRASADIRRGVDVFQPQPAALAALSNRVNAQFDPKQVLNPGRMYMGV